MNPNAIGDRLRELREARKLTQRAMAKDLSVAPSTISNWEKGRRQPSISELKRIAEYLNVSLSDFDVQLAQVMTKEEEQDLLVNHQVIDLYDQERPLSKKEHLLFITGCLFVLFTLWMPQPLGFIPLSIGVLCITWMIVNFFIERHIKKRQPKKTLIPKEDRVVYVHTQEDTTIVRTRKLLVVITLIALFSVMLFYALSVLLFLPLENVFLMFVIMIFALIAIISALNRFILFRKTDVIAKSVPYHNHVTSMHYVPLNVSLLTDCIALIGYMAIIIIFSPVLDTPIAIILAGALAFSNMMLTYFLITRFIQFNSHYELHHIDSKAHYIKITL